MNRHVLRRALLPQLLVLSVSACVAPPGGARPADAGSDADAAPTRSVALTFDDLPGVFLDTATTVARATNDKLLRTLVDAGVPATGFVNESKLRDSNARVEILERWLDAGFDLGNHTYSHADLHGVSLPRFEDEVLRGERVTRAIMRERGRQPRYFRHPYLHTGRDLATRRAFETFLARHGYAVAPVTIDNYDYMFARAYERSLIDGDADAAERVADAYVSYMDTVFGYYEAQSRTFFDREPAQVLLLHVNRLNADMMPALLAMMRRRGYAIVKLERALRDSIYGSEDAYTGPAGITWLHRWALTRGERGAVFAGEPVVPPWIERRAGG